MKKILSQNQQKPEVLAPFAKTFTGEFLESAKKTISNLEVFIRTETKFMQEHSYIFTQDVIKKASSFWGSLLKLIMVYFFWFFLFFLFLFILFYFILFYLFGWLDFNLFTFIDNKRISFDQLLEIHHMIQFPWF